MIDLIIYDSGPYDYIIMDDNNEFLYNIYYDAEAGKFINYNPLGKIYYEDPHLKIFDQEREVVDIIATPKIIGLEDLPEEVLGILHKLLNIDYILENL